MKAAVPENVGNPRMLRQLLISEPGADVTTPPPEGFGAHRDDLAAICATPFSIAQDVRGRWRLDLLWGDEVVTVREAEDHELDSIFALVYRVYVEELRLIGSDRIPAEQIARKRVWDPFDRDSRTRHFVAAAPDRIVGCVRLVAELNGRLPLDLYGFSLAEDRAFGTPPYEIGKLVCDARFRGRSLADAFFALLWYTCREELGIHRVFLSCERRLEPLYAQAGAILIGRFHHSGFDREYSAMRIDVLDDFRTQFCRRISGGRYTAPAEAVLETESLKAAARSALGITICGWRIDEIGRGGGSATAGVYRVRSPAGGVVGAEAWSLIVKQVAASGIDDDPSAASYWRREPLAYSDGFLLDLPPGIRAPRCYGVFERGDSVCILLEDLRERRRPRWSMQDFERAAWQLGRMNGTFAGGRRVPPRQWMSMRWMRDFVESAAQPLAILTNVLGNPLVRRLFPSDSLADVMRVWDARESLLCLLERLPRTFCHGDAVRRNLAICCASDGSDELVALDWAAAGWAPLGQDIAPLVLGSVLMFDAEMEELPELEVRVLAAYIGGLREVGWEGDVRLPRLGFAAGAALRYTLYGIVRLPVLLDPAAHVYAERVMERPLSDVVDRYLGVREHAIGLAREALSAVEGGNGA